ncbi:hypothetical protein CB1_001892004 [Camelus ferus]|nr:hypothetical protein CB1_001892004 [Camelus ferus]
MRTNGNPKHKTNAKQEPLQTLETTQCRPECKGQNQNFNNSTNAANGKRCLGVNRVPVKGYQRLRTGSLPGMRVIRDLNVFVRSSRFVGNPLFGDATSSNEASGASLGLLEL